MPMAGIGTLCTIAGKVYELLQSPLVQQIADYQSDLENLGKTVSSIKNMLLDADKKPELSDEEPGWIDRLKEVLYDADDLFDEIITLTQQMLSVAQTLFAALDNSALKQVHSIWGYKADLDDLKNTIESVKNVLLDAEAKEELSHEAQNYIKNLKDAVYDADDLFDEFVTLAEMDRQLKGGNFCRKVRKFFSSRNSLKVAMTLSTGVQNIRENLKKISHNHKKFRFDVDNKPIRKRKAETCSYVYAPNIIGRDGEMNKVVDELLKPDRKILAIVGVGGLGKTTLAQLVYNHQRVVNVFPLKLWVCISDQDGNEFDVKIILCKILELATGCKIDSDSSLELVHKMFREEFEDKKYLLVLDDLWNENRNKWTELGQFLEMGACGSRVMVTTRSFETATSIGSGFTYPLQGLSVEDSWSLFKMMAFDIGPGQSYPPDFVEIGKQIVEKCANVPLAIKVIGSLLYGQDIIKWQSFQQSELGKIHESQAGIMSILKLSYYNLDSPLKSCFSYCAIFPKDKVINKERLKLHWMALGYVVPIDESQSLEDAAEEYFVILLRRCFFQAVVKDEDGRIFSFVIHDLMHDVAQHVAMNEICTRNNLVDKTRHLYSAGWNLTERSFTSRKIRSCYNAILIHSPLTDISVANWICLRSLTLKFFDSTSLTDSIGNLLHLRFLDLTNSEELKMLPSSITKLHNLQTLILNGCSEMEELPVKFSKLVNLRHLYLKDCLKLTCMPPGMDMLTNLCELTRFVVADESSSGMHRVGQWKDLRGLVKLRGSIEIQICENVRASAWGNDWRGSSLVSAEHLKAMSIKFPFSNDDQKAKNDEAFMENIQLHPSLRELQVYNYSGAKIPVWTVSVDNLLTFMPNLVKIELVNCDQLQQLPPLRKLHHLKHLILQELGKLEYMDVTSYSTTSNDAAASGSGSSSSVAELSFFPSLESLQLSRLSLKGWWYVVGLADRQPPFPRLSTLYIYECPHLTSFPPCPRLENLDLCGVDEALQIVTREDHLSSPLPLPNDNHLPVLMQSNAKNADLNLVVSLYTFNTLPIGPVTSITLYGGGEMEHLSEAEEKLKSCCSTLRSLTFQECGLKSLSGGLELLTALRVT